MFIHIHMYINMSFDCFTLLQKILFTLYSCPALLSSTLTSTQSATFTVALTFLDLDPMLNLNPNSYPLTPDSEPPTLTFIYPHP